MHLVDDGWWSDKYRAKNGAAKCYSGEGGDLRHTHALRTRTLLPRTTTACYTTRYYTTHARCRAAAMAAKRRQAAKYACVNILWQALETPPTASYYPAYLHTACRASIDGRQEAGAAKRRTGRNALRAHAHTRCYAHASKRDACRCARQQRWVGVAASLSW